MNPDKKFILDEIKGRVDESDFVLVVDYTGTTVPSFNELRGRLLEQGAECHVAKNAFMKRVLADSGLHVPCRTCRLALAAATLRAISLDLTLIAKL